MTTHEVMALLDGRITYRQLDYWIRTGRITLSDSPAGSGKHRTFTPIEVAALQEYVAMHELAQTHHAFMVDGSVWLGLLASTSPHLVASGRP